MYIVFLLIEYVYYNVYIRVNLCAGTLQALYSHQV